MTDPAEQPLATQYAERLQLLVRKSPLSHGHIAVVLADMLESDLVILWQLMGNDVQSEPYEELLGPFMANVQNRAETDAQLREAAREAILGQLLLVEGNVLLH